MDKLEGEETGRLLSNEQVDNGKLGLWMATFLLMGEMAGNGILELPLAIVYTGQAGIVLIIIAGFASTFGGLLLSKCLIIEEERNAGTFRASLKSVYPDLGQHVFGKWMRWVISICITVTTYSICTVFLILAAKTVHSVLEDTASLNVPLVAIVVVQVIAVTPFTWLGSPKDFTGVGVVAIVSCFVSIVLIFVAMVIGYSEEFLFVVVEHTRPTASTAFLGFGSILFAYGGVALFPTIQKDMKEPQKLPIATVICFTVITVVYLPMAIFGFLFYGDAVTDNLLDIIPGSWLKCLAECVLVVNLLSAFVIQLNPCSQEMDAIFNVKKIFSVRGCVLRFIVVFLSSLTTVLVPNLEKVIDGLGWSTISLLNFILPAVLFLKVTSNKKDWQERVQTTWEKPVCVVLILLGVTGCICSKYYIIYHLTVDNESSNSEDYSNSTQLLQSHNNNFTL